MIQLSLDRGADSPLKVLCLGCHSDDIEIGCGGTILRLVEQYPRCTFDWVVFSATGVREAEAQRGAELFAGPDRLRGARLQTFRDGFMPFAGAEIKVIFEELKEAVTPDLIFTHYRNDAHQDHRLIADLTWNTFRDHFILEYEIPKYDGDVGQPNVFVPLDIETSQQKVRSIIESFPSQHSRRWFDEKTFEALMRLRGMECNAPSGYAEAFYCRKLVL
ncbi:MAG TPA: PIG-L deacetylase family protein [Terrimicrobiaceae bacterium]|nr:PIG-L deacetylase family protein [Terrimicrobiaceae bacterium]